MKKALLFSLLILMLVVLPQNAEAAGKVVIVSLSRVDVQQVAANDSMAPWLEKASVGLLNTGTAGGRSGRHLYVTLGAGSRALGTDNTRLAFLQEEEYNGTEAGKIFSRHQGLLPTGKILHVGMAELIRVNQTLSYPVQPGLLGNVLHEAGKKTALLGNADAQQFNREAAAMLADSEGQIDLGQIGSAILIHDDEFPYGVRLDKEQMWQEFTDVYPEADVVLIDWGDTVRFEMYRPQLLEEVATRIEAAIFSDVAWLLTRLSETMEADDVLLLLAAVPSSGEMGAANLGLLAALGGPFSPQQLLTSAATRRTGLATVTDIAPLILEQVGLSIPTAMLGRPISVAKGGNVTDLLAMQVEIDRIFHLRAPLLKTYVVFQIIFVLGALANMFIRIIPMRRFEGALLGLMMFPLVLLYLPLDRMSLTAGFAVTIVAVSIAVYGLQQWLQGPVERFAVVAMGTSVSLLVDVMRSAQLMKVSVLGYDPVSGARYYGIGNEYMGVWVGATILGAVAVLTLWPRWRRLLLTLVTAYFMVVLLLMVAPAGGANFGGTLTAMIAFFVTLSVLMQLCFSWRSGAIIFSVVVTVAVLAVLINTRVSQNIQSHLGRTLVLLQNDGWLALRDIIVRKGTMNLKLIRYSQWSRALLAFLAVLAVLFYRPRGVLRDIHKMYPALAAGFLGIIAGSVTALLVNDSGVVAAATTLLYAGVPIIILASRVVQQITFSSKSDK
ncbi:MAG: hypothetical protein NUK65_06400 [Firmicutes bacterium]|nr:hypothetical protein [Bacillota bacterium]